MRKSIYLSLGSFGLIIILACFGMAYAGNKKVTICHYPPGNPDKPQTITVSENALRAHLSHGDTVGECPTGCQADQSICDDGNLCTSDICLSSGECEHLPVDCEDGNPCTLDLCDEAIGCLNPPANGVPCDDGNACTEGDICTDTVCLGQAISDCCVSDLDCDDSNACTLDSCIENSCLNEPKDCTVADKCLVGSCDPTSGECLTAPVSCDDSNICTDDYCDSLTGCYSEPTTNPPEIDETTCDDGLDNDCDGAVDSDDTDCAFCGNAILEASEQCDDGNIANGDGCDQNCNIEACGNGIVQPYNFEQCDDGNLNAGDGCSPSCQVEPGGPCLTEEICTQIRAAMIERCDFYRDDCYGECAREYEWWISDCLEQSDPELCLDEAEAFYDTCMGWCIPSHVDCIQNATDKFVSCEQLICP